MNRRGFFHRLGIGVVALTLARHLPGIAPLPVSLPPPTEERLMVGDTVRIRLPQRFDPMTRGPLPEMVPEYGTFVLQADGVTLREVIGRV